MARYIESAAFVDAATRAFSFLLDRGLLGPEIEEMAVAYTTGPLGIEVLYDQRDGRVITIVQASIGDRTPRAGLICLYVAAGLGPAQHIKDIARSPRRLDPVLATHARALGRLLPTLDGPARTELLLRCHGR